VLQFNKCYVGNVIHRRLHCVVFSPVHLQSCKGYQTPKSPYSITQGQIKLVGGPMPNPVGGVGATFSCVPKKFPSVDLMRMQSNKTFSIFDYLMTTDKNSELLYLFLFCLVKFS